MTVLIIRFAYVCFILLMWSLVMVVLCGPWWLALSTVLSYFVGFLQREWMILVTGKWYDGKPLE